MLFFYFSMTESSLETALASQTVIIRTYSELTKMGERQRGGERDGERGVGSRREVTEERGEEGGSEWVSEGIGETWGGRACLIDSVNRSAGDVNDWTIPFPRSVGQVAMPCPGPIWQTAPWGPGGAGKGRGRQGSWKDVKCTRLICIPKERGDVSQPQPTRRS